jgi:hypothetical protein
MNIGSALFQLAATISSETEDHEAAGDLFRLADKYAKSNIDAWMVHQGTHNHLMSEYQYVSGQLGVYQAESSRRAFEMRNMNGWIRKLSYAYVAAQERIEHLLVSYGYTNYEAPKSETLEFARQINTQV